MSKNTNKLSCTCMLRHTYRITNLEDKDCAIEARWAKWAEILTITLLYVFYCTLLHFKSLKNWANWANWARILKNTLTDEQLCNIDICMLKQTKWAKWARMIKNTFTDEQLCSLTCFFVFARSNTCPNIYSFIPFEIRKKTEPNELNELDYSKTFTRMSSHAHVYLSLYLHAQTWIKTFIYLSH